MTRRGCFNNYFEILSTSIGFRMWEIEPYLPEGEENEKNCYFVSFLHAFYLL
jgi:hypothetical protein